MLCGRASGKCSDLDGRSPEKAKFAVSTVGTMLLVPTLLIGWFHSYLGISVVLVYDCVGYPRHHICATGY